MPFARPQSIPLPTVWHRFSARGKKLRVQDMTEDQVEPAVKLLVTHFTADEPPCKYIGIQNYPSALFELEKLWRDTMKDKMSVVCVEDKDDPSEIIGVNVLTVASKQDKEEAFHVSDLTADEYAILRPTEAKTVSIMDLTDDKIWAKLFGAVELVSKSVDIYTKFDVEAYLTAYGLVVAPKWRGCGIGKEILLARIPLCKALGVKVTATVFTAAASQAVAKKAGFQDLYEISYEELGARGFRFPGVEADTKSSKLMALKIV